MRIIFTYFHIQTVLTALHQVPVQKKHEMIENLSLSPLSNALYYFVCFGFHHVFALRELETELLPCCSNVACY